MMSNIDFYILQWHTPLFKISGSAPVKKKSIPMAHGIYLLKECK